MEGRRECSISPREKKYFQKWGGERNFVPQCKMSKIKDQKRAPLDQHWS